MAGAADIRKGKKQGRYVLGELLGRGGMAEVFSGNAIGSHGFQKPVAIKRLLPELANDEVFVERLISEAKLLVGMAHGNIVSVLDLARDGDDVFLVMEFVDGPSLRQLMKSRGDRGVPFGVTTYIVQAAAAGLEFAHNRPGGAVIHADISPSNILLTTSGEVRVADFGIARREGGGAGVVEGKWAYMAPEQARGEALTPRSDVFALGVVLYELLCGEHPLGRQVTAGERELAPKRIVPPRVVRPAIPPGLDAICMKALAYDPRDRYARMQHVIDALLDERFANGYRESANDLAAMIRELLPGSGPPKEPTQHTARPITLVTRSLLSQLGSVDEELLEPTFEVPKDFAAKLEDSAQQTRQVSLDNLPASLPGGPEPTPATSVVPVFGLSPDMLPAPELSSVHGGSAASASTLDLDAPEEPRSFKWPLAVLAFAAIAGAIAAMVLGSGGKDAAIAPATVAHVPAPMVMAPRAVAAPPAPAPIIPQLPAQPAVAVAGSAAPLAGSAAAPAGSDATTNGTTVATAPVPPPSRSPDKPERPRRNAQGRVAVSPHKEPVAPDGWLHMEMESGEATVTIAGQKKQAPGARFRLPAGAYTARIKDADGSFTCHVTVEPGRTVIVDIDSDDDRCERDDD